MGGGDAELNAVRAVGDVEERRRRNRGRRGGNGRVDAEVYAVKPPKRRGAARFARPNNASGMKACISVANTGRTRERAPTTMTLATWLCWMKKKQCGSRRVGKQGSAVTRGMQPTSMAQRQRG
jgi:hypothetical protein